MMIHNIYPVRCSLFVLAYDVLDSLGLFFEIFVTGRLVLNELVMKKLALFGCTCLLVAHSVKDQVKEGGTDPFAALASANPGFAHDTGAQTPLAFRLGATMLGTVPVTPSSNVGDVKRRLVEAGIVGPNTTLLHKGRALYNSEVLDAAGRLTTRRP